MKREKELPPQRASLFTFHFSLFTPSHFHASPPEAPTLPHALLADLLVGVHLLFVAFVVLGGLLVLRWPRAAWIHLPAAVWGAVIEFAGGICPLTPLEQTLRSRAGQAGYRGGFVEHYLLPVLYPEGLTRNLQVALGVLVLAINVTVYALALRRRRSSPPRTAPAAASRPAG